MKHLLSRATWPVLALAIPIVASADETIRIEKNRVVPVVMEDSVSLRDSRRGDRFEARVENGYDLPYGTRFMGRVLDLRRKEGNRPAYIEVEFYQIQLPDGTRTRIRAVPVSMDGAFVKRDRDGRYRATGKLIRRDHIVLGSMALGGLLASAIKKPVFSGILVGAVAGIIVAETQRIGNEENVAIRRGTRIGAMFDESVSIRFDGEWRRDEYDPQRDDRYDDRYDRNDDRYDDRDSSWNDDQWNEERVEFRNRELRFEAGERPFRIGESLMVPLRTVADQLDLQVTRWSDTRIRIENEADVVEINPASSEYRFNGRRQTMRQEPERRRSEWFVPIEILAQLRSEPIYWNGERVRVRN